MPSKGTPKHNIRAPEDLWQEAKRLARKVEGADLSTVLRRDLERHVAEWRRIEEEQPE